MYSLQEKNKKGKDTSSTRRHRVKPFFYCHQKNGTIAPIQCYNILNVIADFKKSDHASIVSHISGCTSLELDFIYQNYRESLIRMQNEFTGQEYATVISYLITRENSRDEFPKAFNNLIDLLKIQLNNKSIAASLIDQKVIIIKSNQELTDHPVFQSWKSSSSTGGSGQWSTTRGAGAYRYSLTVPASPTITQGSTPIAYGSATIMKNGKAPAGAVDFKYTAVAEEDLDPTVSPDPRFMRYDAGYSVGAHEFAHTIHEFGVTDAHRVEIGMCYEAFLGKGESAEWVDGPKWNVAKGPCYASTNVKEYFAQSSNAYLKRNAGNDTATGKARHNGWEWLRDNDPDMLRLLDNIYGTQRIS